MMKFRYFVSYSAQYRGNGSLSEGFGNCEISCGFEIKGIDEIRILQDDIEKKNELPPKSVIILNYQLLDK